MLYIFRQNFYKIYPIIVKTRRYKTYQKNIFIPFNFSSSLEFLLLKTSMNLHFHIKSLNLLYHINSVWYFYNNSIFWKKASLTNNLNYSYDYWFLRNQLNLFTLIPFHAKYHIKCNLNYYIKPVKIFNFHFKNKKLSLLFILLFIHIFKLGCNYTNLKRLVIPHVIITDLLNLFVFNNYYYFKIRNY